MSDINKFTPTERAMLDVLMDGKVHTPEELHACLYDEYGPISNIRYHLSCLRKKLRPWGEDIVCVFRERKRWYQHVKLIAPPDQAVKG